MRTAKQAEFLDLVRTGLTVYYVEQVVKEEAEGDAAGWVMDRLAAAYTACKRIPIKKTALQAAEDFIEAIRRPEKTPDWLEEPVTKRGRGVRPPLAILPP